MGIFFSFSSGQHSFYNDSIVLHNPKVNLAAMRARLDHSLLHIELIRPLFLSCLYIYSYRYNISAVDYPYACCCYLVTQAKGYLTFVGIINGRSGFNTCLKKVTINCWLWIQSLKKVVKTIFWIQLKRGKINMTYRLAVINPAKSNLVHSVILY